MEIPNFVTHYYLPGRRPLLNLSDLEGSRLREVVTELQELTRAGKQSRRFGQTYLEWRQDTESELRSRFCARGGQPERQAPHYFILGSSLWYEGLAPDMQSLTLPLAALPKDQTSWTLTDSFHAMGLGERYGYPAPDLRHDDSVYLLADLERVLSAHVVKDERLSDYTNFATGPTSQFIEVQLWSDGPVAHLL